ncbi:L-threonine dehydrogenase [Sporosarcina sp. P37]|uniref:iron-containing alcohol dehydrogenase n=1 Tax=unclassified Sporosarcina TaxID=2647733 RepID=UPI0009C1709D|nr:MULTISPECIES: iron-containing alcohol dehydrogenase [unclassified Sporosarcina]ARD48804.1 L-threonine dehydrogenase [Sporosarcina sp. P33]ARK25306.1 L-threonine dehydrogenase [Sporosarcina sp. P37]PID17541.1 L-threonine dehydrogenase [Sporosarcina sp. P35]
MSKQTQFNMPAINLFGRGTINEVGVRLKDLGISKALIVTDAGLHALGMSEQVAEIIRKEGIDAAIFAEAEPNPTDRNVEEGLAVFESEKCDALVSLGGGSSHDAAKGIGLVAANGGRIHDYEGVDKSENASTPLIAINTTSGTASEMTKFTIITDSEKKVKMAIVDKHITPLISINDPDLTVKKPVALTAATGVDALTHAIEAFVSTNANPLTDACAIQAMKIIPKYLPRAVANGEDIEAREQMVYAQFLGGMAFNNASLGYVHAIAHQMGGFYNYPHGECNAILLPHVCRFNLISRQERFAEIAGYLGVRTEGMSTRDAAESAITALERFTRDLGIPSGFKAMGAKEEDIDILAENAMKDVTAVTNPRKPTLEQVKQIIRDAM